MSCRKEGHAHIRSMIDLSKDENSKVKVSKSADKSVSISSQFSSDQSGFNFGLNQSVSQPVSATVDIGSQFSPDRSVQCSSIGSQFSQIISQNISFSKAGMEWWEECVAT